jgi:hypothetical protein
MTGAMNPEAAFELTNRIRNNTNELAHLMRQAHSGKAWLALDFATFEDWVRESFGWHRSRAYQLLNLATIEEDLRGAVALPSGWSLSDRQAREITHIGIREFLRAITSLAQADVEANARLIVTLIRTMPGSTASTSTTQASNVSPIRQTAPSIIANGLRNSRTAVHMANSLTQQARMLPQASSVAESLRPQVVTILQAAITDAQRRLDEFEQAANERLGEGVADAV